MNLIDNRPVMYFFTREIKSSSSSNWIQSRMQINSVAYNYISTINNYTCDDLIPHLFFYKYTSPPDSKSKSKPYNSILSHLLQLVIQQNPQQKNRLGFPGRFLFFIHQVKQSDYYLLCTNFYYLPDFSSLVFCAVQRSFRADVESCVKLRNVE